MHDLIGMDVHCILCDIVERAPRTKYYVRLHTLCEFSWDALQIAHHMPQNWVKHVCVTF